MEHDRRQGERRQEERRTSWAEADLELSPEARLERKVDGIGTAVFGNEYDSEDHGLVGAVRDVGRKLDRVFHTLLGTMGVLLMVAVTIALAVHH